jgi:uncharacterized glyoxalase superfamily protein PhnB
MDVLVAAPREGQPVTQGIYVVVDNVDIHYARAKAAGAEIVVDIKTQDYGGRDYAARELERPCLDLRRLRSFGWITA